MKQLPNEKEIMSFWDNDTDKPVVSVSCIAYNHEAYIEDALKGFLIQQTAFPFEILIHDDASTDRTADIISKYEAKYPKLIKPIYQTENQYSKGKRINSDFNYPRAKGEYIALCEGDDYWTDKKKLQKQVSFLNGNTNYAMSSHAVDFEFDGVFEKRMNYSKSVVDASFQQILELDIFIALNSIVFRKSLFDRPKWLDGLPGGHKALIYILTSKGKNHHFEEDMAVKRRNPGGMTIREKGSRADTYYERNIFLLENMKVYLRNKQNKPINKKLRKFYLRQILKEMKEFRLVKATKNIMKMIESTMLES